MAHISNRKDISVVLAVWSPGADQPTDLTGALPSQTAQPASATPCGVQTILSPAAPTPLAAHSSARPTSAWQEQQRGAPGLCDGVRRLARDILARGGYGAVEVGYCRNGHPSVEEAIERAVAHGARRVVVVPMVFALGGPLPHPSSSGYYAGTTLDELPGQISKMQARYQEADIVYAGPPFDHERQVDLILSKIREYEPKTSGSGLLRLNDLAVGELGTVRQLDGGSNFRSRLASLGFTPGVAVEMVQNYGHGAVIVRVRGTRVALGRGEASKVGVSVVSSQ